MKSTNRWHRVTKKDQKRIVCMTCEGEGTPRPAEVCEHAEWDTGNTKGISFWYYCLAHGIERGYHFSSMTPADLLNIEWNCMTDYPKVGCPWRTVELAHQQITNEHGVTFDAVVFENRTRNRWWLEVINAGWLRAYLTTTSKRKRDLWLSAFAPAAAAA